MTIAVTGDQTDLVGGPGDGCRLARTTLGNERVNIANGSVSQGGHRPRLLRRDEPAAAAPDRRLASGRRSQRAQGHIRGQRRRPAPRAVLDWNGAAAAALSSPSRDYLSVPPQLI